MTAASAEVAPHSAWFSVGQVLLLSAGGVAFGVTRFYQPEAALGGLMLTGASIGTVVGLGPRFCRLRRLSPELLTLLGGALVGIGAIDAFRGAQIVARAIQIGKARQVLSGLLIGLEEIGWGGGILGSAAKAVLLFAIALREQSDWAVDKERQIEDALNYPLHRPSGGERRTLGGLWRRLSLVFSKHSGADELTRYLREEYRCIPPHLLADFEAYAADQDQVRQERLESGFAMLSERQISEVLGEPSLRDVSPFWLVDRLRAHNKLRALELAVEDCLREFPEGGFDGFLERLAAVESAMEEGASAQSLQDQVESLAADRQIFEGGMRRVEPFAVMLSQVPIEDGLRLTARNPEEVLLGLEILGERFSEVREPVTRLADDYRQARAVRVRLRDGDALARLERLTSRCVAEGESSAVEDADEAFRAIYQEIPGASRVTELLLDTLALEDPMEIERTLFQLGLCTADDLVEARILFTREGSRPEDFKVWEEQSDEERLQTVREGLLRYVEERRSDEAGDSEKDVKWKKSLTATYHLAAEGVYYAICAAIAVHWVASAPRIFGIGLVVGAIPALLLAQQSDAVGLASRDLTQLTINQAREELEGTAERFARGDLIGQGQQIFWTCVIPSLALTLLRQFGVGGAGAVVGASVAFSVANWSRFDRVEGMSWSQAAQNFIYVIRT